MLWGKNEEMKKLTKLSPEDEEAQTACGSRHSESHKGSSHGGDKNKDADEDKDDDDEPRSSFSSTEVASTLYMCP